MTTLVIVSVEKEGHPIPRLQEENVAKAINKIANGINFLTNFVFIIIIFDRNLNYKNNNFSPIRFEICF